jgi:predicted amidohydrolase
MIWAQGDGSTLEVYDTPLGKRTGLICWENYMSLARYALYAWGTQLYLAPTWDRDEPWLSTLRHITKEGRVYVVGCSIALRKEDIPDRVANSRQNTTPRLESRSTKATAPSSVLMENLSPVPSIKKKGSDMPS